MKRGSHSEVGDDGLPGRCSGFSTGGAMSFVAVAIVGLIVYMIAYLFSQGGTVFAVSEIYLGKATTIGQSLGRVRGEFAT